MVCVAVVVSGLLVFWSSGILFGFFLSFLLSFFFLSSFLLLSSRLSFLYPSFLKLSGTSASVHGCKRIDVRCVCKRNVVFRNEAVGPLVDKRVVMMTTEYKVYGVRKGQRNFQR